MGSERAINLFQQTNRLARVALRLHVLLELLPLLLQMLQCCVSPATLSVNHSAQGGGVKPADRSR